MENNDWLFDKILLGIVAVCVFLFLTIVLMIPIANVFIAKALFEDKKEGKENA